MRTTISKTQINHKQAAFLPVFSPLVYLLCIFFICSPLLTFAQDYQRCLATRYDSLLAIKYPGLPDSKRHLNALINKKRASARIHAVEGVIVIPVVVHVVHHTASGAIGGASNGNISKEQIDSQIEVLNEDYRRKIGTNGYNDNPVGDDMEIEFRLATRDPNGKSTEGVTRTYNTKESFDIDQDDETLKSIIVWPTDRYLNIWVTTLKNRYLGYAQFPVVDNVGGLPDLGKLANTDGVVINHANFGKNTGTVTSNTYGDGRTTTHEVAHWLGLLHTWGDENCGEDYCADTPSAEGPNNTVNCDEMFSDCQGTFTQNMIENFLDYSPDKCMNVFTQDQKGRIHSVLELSPRRATLIKRSGEAFESGLVTMKLYPNPAKDDKVTIQLTYTNLNEISFQVVSVTGKRMNELNYRLSGNKIELNTRNLPVGLYIVQVSSPKETRTARLMVVR
ncbi:T9SS type A sorting domain-containing protein [Rhodocytophaga rosea]|uniref:T9SS type A sorting domain-containing protein n=1 Tax=Rhodocytophaga rosea TaxID=2704465 RepID=A0A6C0GFI3_9BACT|nr:T9SS type A sorting domain-containing protein [Rhodocytophaga rosea]QHT66697.1 T9SS type A sorting domain-containing protein [Rhodocytophaga rosea]